MIVLTAIVLLTVVEMVTLDTPLDVLMGGIRAFRPGKAREHTTVIRVGAASWQMAEFPWDEAIARYNETHKGQVEVRIEPVPESGANTMLLCWKSGVAPHDVLVAFYDGEIQPFMNYGWNSKDPEQRSLIIDFNDYLTPQQIDSFAPAFFAGSSRRDPDTGRTRRYMLPWMGEVLALNYNREFFREAGVTKVPETWEEVEEVCRKLKGLKFEGREVAPLAMNFAQQPFFGQNCYIPMLAAFKRGRGITDEKGRIDVSSPEAVRVFETLKRWSKAGYVTREAFVSDSVDNLLRTRRAAMYPHWQSRGLWAVGDHGPDVIGIALTPGVKEAGALTIAYGCLIPKCSPVKAEAAKVCYELFCTDEYGFQSGVTRGFMREGKRIGGGKMPVLKAMYAEKDLPPGVAELGKGLDRGYFYPDPTNWAECADKLVVEFQKYLRGATPTAEEALAEVRRRLAEEVYPGK
jgi:ABC-type glycerol-3-phosphate transport system substrate-binding protein